MSETYTFGDDPAEANHDDDCDCSWCTWTEEDIRRITPVEAQ